MSVAVGSAFSASKDTPTVHSNRKAEDQKNGEVEKLCCEFDEKSEDLSKEFSKETGDCKDDCVKCEQPEMDKGDETLRERKQQVHGSINPSSVGESKEAEVQILSLSVLSPGRPDVVLGIPFPATTSKATLFTLKEGSKYRIKFHFTVSKHVVRGLKYTYMVWKAGVRVHQTKMVVGTFYPRQEPYTFELEEGTTPSGFFARGPFFVRSKFLDDDDSCYLDTTYYFDIRKDWGARDKC